MNEMVRKITLVDGPFDGQEREIPVVDGDVIAWRGEEIGDGKYAAYRVDQHPQADGVVLAHFDTHPPPGWRNGAVGNSAEQPVPPNDDDAE